MRWMWSVLLVAACGRSHFDDAALDTGPSGSDSSGSGDFDGDSVVDGTDNCPAQFNANQADSDGDGVGDACDAHPAAPGDSLVIRGLFSAGFGDWSPDDIANWSITAGKAESQGDVDTAQSRLSLIHNFDQPTIELAFTVEDYGTLTGNAIAASFAFPGRTSTCLAADDGSSLPIVGTSVYQDGTLLSGIALPSGRIGVGAIATLAFTRNSNDIDCIVAGGAVNAGVVPADAQPATVTIEVRGIKATLSYALIYDY